MSLMAWYPLDGNTKNYGAGNLAPGVSGTITYAAGKIGAQSLKGGSLTWTAEQTASILNNNEFSIAFWIKPTGTGYGAIFGNTSMGMNNNRKFTVYTYPGPNDLHWSWMNDIKDTTYAGGTIKGIFPTNKWTHCCITYKNPNGCVYINGVQKQTFYGVSNSSTFHYATTVLHSNTDRCINDLRIYNHCLSVREVQYVSQGLMLHLPLKDLNLENTTNLAPYPTPGSAASPGWDASLHPDAISVSNWTNGYNSGVSTNGVKNPEVGYHAYWKLIDGIPTMVFQHLNSQINLGNRWLGISCGGFQNKIGPSKTYTISFDAKANVDGVVVSTGYHYRLTNGSSNSFHDGCPNVAVTTSWKRYSFTFTTSSALNTAIGASMYVYGHNGSVKGIAYVRNFQVELNDHATSYTPYTRTATVMDCSGYQHHGSVVGTVATKKDSSRYNSCIYQNNGPNNYLKSGIITMPTDAITMSCWFKSNSVGYSDYHIPMSLASANYEISIDSGGRLRNGFVINGSRQVLTTSHTSILDNKWHMLTATYDGTTIKRYLDGKEIPSSATSVTGTLAGTTGELLVGSYGSGGYGNKNAYMSDVRVYATALSADMIKTLYESRISMNSTGDLMAYEFIEDAPTHLKMTDAGLIRTGEVSETHTYYGMPIKSLDDGSIWARIHWLDVTGPKSWFANATEVAECLNQSNRFSRMGVVDQFKSTRIKITNLMPAVHTDNYNGGTADSTYRKYSDYSLKAVGKVDANESFIFTKNNIPYIPGHTYYCCCNILQETIQGSSDMYWKVAEPYIMGGRKVSEVKTWTRVSAVRSAQSIINYAGSDWAAGDYQARWDYNNGKKEGAMWFDGFMLIDLTAAFGAGNEPTAAWCDQNIPYFTGSKQINFDNDTYAFYEFMLTYPRLSKTLYNRWKQSSSPNASAVTGFTPIVTVWSAHNGGIRKNGSACLYNCDTGSTWYAPIGQYSQWTDGKYIPAADGSSQTETELWIRIDTLSNINKISMFDNKFIQAFNIYET